MTTIHRCWSLEHSDRILSYCVCSRFVDLMRQFCHFPFLMCKWFSAYTDSIILIIESVFDSAAWLWWMLPSFYDLCTSLERVLLLRKLFIASVLLLSLTVLYRVCRNSVRLTSTSLRSMLQNVIFHHASVVYTPRSLSLMRRFSSEYLLLNRTSLTRVLRNKHF